MDGLGSWMDLGFTRAKENDKETKKKSRKMLTTGKWVAVEDGVSVLKNV